MSADVSVPQESDEPLPPRVAAELLNISRLLALGDRPARKNGRCRIGPTHRRILAFLLSRSSHRVTLSNLAQDTLLSPAAASEAVRKLKERGLIRKVRSRDDARVVHLSLSAAGRRKAERAADGSNHLSAAIGKLTRREQELALHTLKTIQQAMDRREKSR
jgi:DNA-binding MarR family transcriptional regulator